MSSFSPSSTIYSPSQVFPSPYKYEDLGDHQIPRSYPEPYHGSPDQTPHKHHQKTQSTLSAEAKGRLRKACDSCSVRKVKCDESGPPCKSCAALEIPCTFERPSRRRGPPNRHAEALKRQKLTEDGSYATADVSPTHDAAYSLAALSTPMPLSAESICDLATLEILIDDYFIYIHPLIPLPHEPTFRAAFARREDRTDRSFLALLASMIEALVASFPRRPRQLFTSEESRRRFPNAGVLIDKCHQVFAEARGIGYLDRDLNLYDACGSYFAGLAAGYMFDMHRIRMYFGECVMALRSLNFHRNTRELELLELNAQNPAGGEMQPPKIYQRDYIEQESGRRLFWLCFVGCLSIRQLGGTDADLLVPPMSHAEMLPPMALEVDDEYIFETHIEPQPSNVVSALTGFNLNVRVFRAFHALTALEMAFGTNELYDWERQRRVIRQALLNVKAVTVNAPPELELQPTNAENAWPPNVTSPSAYSHLLNGRQDPSVDVVGLPSHDSSSGQPYPRRAVQYEIQKANIYATQLATRSYLVEKFWNLYELREGLSVPSDRTVSSGSPTIGALAAGVDYTYQSWQSRTPSDHLDAGEQAMAVEREDIVRDLAVLLRSINQVNMEPNGLSFCHKIRQVASTLIETKRPRMSVMPTLDSEAVNAYLIGFLDILSKLERLGSGRVRGHSNTSYDSHGYPFSGHGADMGQTPEEVEEEELVQWASLKKHQERFVKANGFVAGL